MNRHLHATAPVASCRLSIRVLGDWQFLSNGAPVRGKLYGKVVALVAYLVVQPDRSHPREHLASLLWPQMAAESARANLRQALRHLRHALASSESDFLVVTRDAVRFNVSHPDCSVDTAVLEASFHDCGHCAGPSSPAPCDDCVNQLESRLAVYRGEFLAGLALPDAPEFETWLSSRRHSLRERAFLIAERLCSAYEARGGIDMALSHAQRCMELEPWNETAHRKYMRLLAAQGQYATAQVHYDAYCDTLAHDLNSDPAASTHALFETIHKTGIRAAGQRKPDNDGRPPPPRAERRQVTILCCHLDLTTDIQGDHTEQLAESRSVCAAVLRRHAGHLSQGHDGYFYAYMGYPVASEQAGRQAVLAACELLSLFGPPYRFRAGIHTDIIVAGFDPFLPDIIGSASGTAWRLCRRRRGSGIVVSDSTEQLLRGQFPLRALACAQGKGAGESTPEIRAAYLLLSPSGDARYDSPATPPQMVGRRGELQRLLKLWRTASGGDPQFLVLRGEPGIGKSRLARALRDEAARRAAGIRHLHCYPEHRHTPLYPVIALFESILGISTADTPAAQRHKLREYLRRQHPAVAAAAEPILMMLLSIAPAGAPAPSPRQRKQQTLEMMLLLLDSLASRQPLLLIIEDAQWLDVTTLDLLQRMLHRKSSAALFTLITARSEFTPGWLKDESVLELRPLPDTDIARLARATAGALSASAVASIVRRADGVPFYAEQMARMSARGPDGNDIPSTLRDLLLARVDSVPRTRRLLQLAATIGRRFDQGLLQRVSALDAPAMESALSRLIDAHLISATASTGNAFQFRHALIQEAAYDSQLQTDRQDAHRRVAQALTRHYPQLAAQQPAEIAHHYTSAGDADAAVSWWLNAGRQALRVCATADACRHLEQGLSLIARLPPGENRDSREMALLLSLGQAVQLGKGYGAQDAVQIYDRALELNREGLPLKQRFEVSWGLWTVSSSRPGHGFLKARDLAQELLALAQRSGERKLLVKAHTANANVALWLNQPEDVCLHAEAVVGVLGGDLDETFDGLDPVVTCLAYRSWAHWRRDRDADALADSHRSLQRARALNNPDSLCLALGFAAMLRRFLGDMQGLAEHTDELEASTAIYQLATWQGVSRMLRGWIRAKQGDASGIAILQACGEGIQHVMPSVAGLFLHALAEGNGFVQRHEEQLQAVEEGIAVCRKVDERFFGSMLERMRDERQAER